MQNSNMQETKHMNLFSMYYLFSMNTWLKSWDQIK